MIMSQICSRCGKCTPTFTWTPTFTFTSTLTLTFTNSPTLTFTFTPWDVKDGYCDDCRELIESNKSK